MQSLLMASVHRNDIIIIFIICMGVTAFSWLACWRAWGIDIHKHLEEVGVAYDVVHPEEREAQIHRAEAGPYGAQAPDPEDLDDLSPEDREKLDH